MTESAMTDMAVAPHRWIAAAHVGYADVTAMVADALLRRHVGARWWLAVGVSFLFVLLTLGTIVYLFAIGVGLWGVNTTVVWGYALANYVWWIAIGSGGTLISSILVLTGQPWRNSISRFAESMTVFAVAISGLYPILHLGRPQYFYWLTPYPNTMALWPQWRSALVWDFWAILSYLLFSILFLYVGLLPDLATMRDRATSRTGQRLYGAIALGWSGSTRQWRVYRRLHTTLAAVALPLVVSVHSIVGLDFAASLMPGWQESIYPPYFVVGALFSGFAMVLLLTAAVRWSMRLEAIITLNHFDAMAKVILAAAFLMLLSYATEWFLGWYSGEAAERAFVAYSFTGDYAAMYWALLSCNCILPQALWWRRVRRSLPALVIIAALILVGMWIERILIVWNTLSHGYAAPMWRVFHPTALDWILLFGPLGAFVFMFLLLMRLIPPVSMFEVRRLCREQGVA
jgi:molybdopterin-containing oxidoreductase family membrane subunit